MKSVMSVDRLHKVIEQINTRDHIETQGVSSVAPHAKPRYTSFDRTSNLSAGYLELMVAELLICQDVPNVYLYVGETRAGAEKMMRRLYDRLRQENITVETNGYTLWRLHIPNGPTIVGTGPRASIETLASHALPSETKVDRVFCDVDLRLRAVDYVTYLKRELAALLVNGGDIV